MFPETEINLSAIMLQTKSAKIGTLIETITAPGGNHSFSATLSCIEIPEKFFYLLSFAM